MIEEVRTNKRGNKLCNAKDNTCGGLAMRGVEKCRVHGGASPRGIASPHFKTGQHSRYLTAIPGRLKKDFQSLAKRDDILELNDDIGLVDSRLLDVLRRVEQGENGAPDAVWAALQKALSDFQQARAKGETGIPDMLVAVKRMEHLIERGVADFLAWKEVYSLLDQRRRLVESERKRFVEQQEVITSKEAFLLINALLSVVNEHVTDRDTKGRIQQGFIRIVGDQDNRGLRAAG